MHTLPASNRLTADDIVDEEVGPLHVSIGVEADAIISHLEGEYQRELAGLAKIYSEPSVPPLVDFSNDALIAKRVLDVMISLVAIVLFAPIMIAIAIAIKASSPGSAFFSQERVGEGGQVFNVFKFRSMSNGTHSALMNDAPARRQYEQNDFKMAADDPRITGIGRFIRATSIDELPQLFNVLRGEMSIVGIRPLLAPELAQRDHFDRLCYQAFKPGMTGLWQVSGRSTVTSEDRHALDRQYVQTWSVLNDLKVIIKTPIAVLSIGQTC